MSIFSPPQDWFRAPEGAEKTWIGLSLLWCMVLSIAMPYWHYSGKQTSSGEAYLTTPADFEARVTEFIGNNTAETRTFEYKKSDGTTGKRQLPVVTPTPKGDAYLIGKNWSWYPVLKLKKDKEYALHISSGDFQHGFSLLPMNMNFQILPGYDHVIRVTPNRAGNYQIVCNEFCGPGHHLMTGLIIVEE